MRCEAEIHERLRLGELELQHVAEDMNRLSVEIKLGGNGLRQAQDRLSQMAARQQSLRAQMDSLRWVLTGEGDRIAG
jgi:hypothetical protein